MQQPRERLLCRARSSLPGSNIGRTLQAEERGSAAAGKVARRPVRRDPQRGGYASISAAAMRPPECSSLARPGKVPQAGGAGRAPEVGHGHSGRSARALQARRQRQLVQVPQEAARQQGAPHRGLGGHHKPAGGGAHDACTRRGRRGDGMGILRDTWVCGMQFLVRGVLWTNLDRRAGGGGREDPMPGAGDACELEHGEPAAPGSHLWSTHLPPGRRWRPAQR